MTRWKPLRASPVVPPLPQPTQPLAPARAPRVALVTERNHDLGGGQDGRFWGHDVGHVRRKGMKQRHNTKERHQIVMETSLSSNMPWVHAYIYILCKCNKPANSNRAFVCRKGFSCKRNWICPFSTMQWLIVVGYLVLNQVCPEMKCPSWQKKCFFSKESSKETSNLGDTVIHGEPQSHATVYSKLYISMLLIAESMHIYWIRSTDKERIIWCILFDWQFQQPLFDPATCFRLPCI